MHGTVGNGCCARLAGFHSRVGPDTIDFRFRFSAESPASLSVAHTVSAECVTSLSVYFRFRPKVEFPLSVDLYMCTKQM